MVEILKVPSIKDNHYHRDHCLSTVKLVVKTKNVFELSIQSKKFFDYIDCIDCKLPVVLLLLSKIFCEKQILEK